ncbi:hypothetical protein BT69DRAFT_1275882, partial [Atractiella rhizophila]
MQITVATNEGQMYTLEVDGSMELETLMALLEADVRPSRPHIVLSGAFRAFRSETLT